MKEDKYRDFPGGPVVKTPSFQCREHVFPSLVGEIRSHMMLGVAKKKKKKKKKPDTKDHLNHMIPFICNVLNREIYRETTTEDERAGWHHRLNGHEFG